MPRATNPFATRVDVTALAMVAPRPIGIILLRAWEIGTVSRQTISASLHWNSRHLLRRCQPVARVCSRPFVVNLSESAVP